MVTNITFFHYFLQLIVQCKINTSTKKSLIDYLIDCLVDRPWLLSSLLLGMWRVNAIPFRETKLIAWKRLLICWEPGLIYYLWPSLTPSWHYSCFGDPVLQSSFIYRPWKVGWGSKNHLNHRWSYQEAYEDMSNWKE